VHLCYSVAPVQNKKHNITFCRILTFPSESVAEDQRNPLSLSGGERSYSTVSLILAMWQMMEGPFRAMDEFDVFMDARNRKIAYNLFFFFVDVSFGSKYS
jgi:hypothetical protein